MKKALVILLFSTLYTLIKAEESKDRLFRYSYLVSTNIEILTGGEKDDMVVCISVGSIDCPKKQRKVSYYIIK